MEKAINRKELQRKLGSYEFYLEGMEYTVDDVYAESNFTRSVTGLASGAIIGSVMGAVGAAVGGVIGSSLGLALLRNDFKKVESFNASNALL